MKIKTLSLRPPLLYLFCVLIQALEHMKRVVSASTGKCSGVEERAKDEGENQITRMGCQQNLSLPETPETRGQESGDLGL